MKKQYRRCTYWANCKNRACYHRDKHKENLECDTGCDLHVRVVGICGYVSWRSS